VWFTGIGGPHAIIHFSYDGYTYPYG